MNSYTYDFTHELDKQALAALEAIPGFSLLLKGFMKIFSERNARIVNLSSSVKLSEKQMPEIYNLLPPICEKLRIDMPEFYLQLNPMPNACTGGDNNPYIIINSGLVEYLDRNEIKAVLAHECGHIACHHVLYHTMGRMLLSGGASMFGIPAIFTEALSAAMSWWMRCSEFSCDRAGAIVMGGPDLVIDVMLRLAGAGSRLGLTIDREEFMKQAAEYKSYVGTSAWNKLLETYMLKNLDHPLLAVRAYDIDRWCRSDAFHEAMGRKQLAAPMQTGKCPVCHSKVLPEWVNCPFCGAKVKF